MVMADDSHPTIRDWILLEGKMAWKFREFAHDCLGLHREYDTGQFGPGDLLGHWGYLELREPDDGKQGKVKRYLPRSEFPRG